MMNNYEFEALSENEKAEVTWGGIFLGSRVNGELKILLYRVNDFYVEVYYDNENNEIKRFRTFKRLHQLAPYV